MVGGKVGEIFNWIHLEREVTRGKREGKRGFLTVPRGKWEENKDKKGRQIEKMFKSSSLEGRFNKVFEKDE